MRRRALRGLLHAALALVPLLAAAQPSAAAPAPKVLRTYFTTAETGFDPARITDVYSRTVTAHIFEGLYGYDPLARPAKIVPLTAAGAPEVSADFRVWTVRLRPGIFFAADPAFRGRPRELVADDYVYAFKRFADPALRSAVWSFLEEFGIEGLKAQRDRALKAKKPFDYDAALPGLRALDRYTFQMRLDKPRPSLLELLAGGDLFGAVAREVVDFYGDDITAHPVGTGPFRLAQWRRSSLIVLERNPGYRERFFAAEPAPGDAGGQALLQRFKGRRLPMIDRVEVSILEAEQPRWLSFLNGRIDHVAVPADYIDQAMPNGVVAPNLARRGIRGFRELQPDTSFTYFNMKDPTVGGMTPDKVALRRAISLGIDIEREIRLVRRGQAIPAQSPIVPHTSGYDPAFKSAMSEYDPAKAQALLDLYGYADRDGDGWREMPDGSPLALEIATQPDQNSRQHDELWKRNMGAIGIRTRFATSQWAEQLRQAEAGKLMMWNVGITAASYDGLGALALLHGPQAGGSNLAHFRLDAMDRLYERMGAIADGPEREALFLQAKRLAVAYMPYRHHVHRHVTDLVQPWLIGFRRPVFWQEWWHVVDIDPSRRTGS
jgi:ABC-type transport system substrate-binding protein